MEGQINIKSSPDARGFSRGVARGVAGEGARTERRAPSP